MRRILVPATALLLATSALAGCMGGDDPAPTPTPTSPTSPTGGTTPTTPTSPTTPTTPGTVAIVVGTTDTITSLDPGNAYEYLSVNILQNTMGTLVSYKPDSTELEPDLAASLPTVSADGLWYNFTLKSGLKYADGKPIKAADFLWALERNSGKVAGAEGGPAFLIYDSPGVDVANSTAPDDTHVNIKLKQPGVFFLSLLAFPNFAPIPKDAYTTSAWREPTGPVANLPVSSGPYMITQYLQGQAVTLAKNPNYAGPKAAKAATVTIKIFSQSSALKAALETGGVDVAYRTFTPQEWKDLAAKTGTIRAVEEPGPSPARYLNFNVQKDPFKGISGENGEKVRQAISYAVDRDDIDTAVFQGTATPLYSIVPAGFTGQKDSFKTKYGATPNLEKAKELLTAAGYSTTNKLSFTLWYNNDGHYGDTEDELAQVLKEQIEDTGMVTVKLDSRPWAQYKVDFRAGTYGAFLLGWFPDYLDADDYISPFLTKGGAASFGTFYDNPAVVALIKKEQAGGADRASVIGQIQDAAADDVPMLPLFTGTQQVAARTGVAGAELWPNQVFPYWTLSK